jgi:hypothetical protein
LQRPKAWNSEPWAMLAASCATSNQSKAQTATPKPSNTASPIYNLDAWGESSGKFKPFGRLLAVLFSRRLQQLIVPLSGLDTSHGISSDVLHLVDPASREVRYTAWVRELLSTNHVLYAGSYSVCTVPGFDGPCIKVVFPLPNGNAMVIMRPEIAALRCAPDSAPLHMFGWGLYPVIRHPARCRGNGAQPIGDSHLPPFLKPCRK